jgi:acyl-CoA synthetase (AMP-forming)/AMP-acid ligase II
MQTEYFDNAEATERSFKDGWLLSEDVGVLHGARRLQIMGRRDDMMNVGGAKVAPSTIEEIVLRLISARDVGAFSQPSGEGFGEIWIAVVDAQVDDRELWTRLERGLQGLQFATFHIVRLPQIPRNPAGKIQRDLLRRAVVEAREVPRPA